MKYCTLLVMLLACTFARAQNLVPNPNFTLHTLCPMGFSHVDYVYNWYPVTQGTPDYFNSCDTSAIPPTGVPNNFLGFQTSTSGCYCGLHTSYITASTGDYKEYMGTDVPALLPGAYYRVTLVVSLANGYYCPTAGLAVYFYINATPDNSIVTPITYKPQVDYSSYGVIADTTNWVVLTKVFKADSAYTHLVIGNFRSADSLIYAPVCDTNRISYYYIDSVAVERVIQTGAEDADASFKASVYPNPFSDHAALSFPNPSGYAYQLQVFNADGRIVSTSEDITGERVLLDKNIFPPGLYYYKLWCEQGNAAFGKFLVR